MRKFGMGLGVVALVAAGVTIAYCVKHDAFGDFALSWLV